MEISHHGYRSVTICRIRIAFQAKTPQKTCYIYFTFQMTRLTRGLQIVFCLLSGRRVVVEAYVIELSMLFRHLMLCLFPLPLKARCPKCDVLTSSGHSLCEGHFLQRIRQP